MTFEDFLSDQYCLSIEEFSDLDESKKKLYEEEFESFLNDIDEDSLDDNCDDEE